MGGNDSSPAERGSVGALISFPIAKEHGWLTKHCDFAQRVSDVCRNIESMNQYETKAEQLGLCGVKRALPHSTVACQPHTWY